VLLDKEADRTISHSAPSLLLFQLTHSLQQMEVFVTLQVAHFTLSVLFYPTSVFCFMVL